MPFSTSSIDTDWFLLSLRLIFIVVLYFFLYQILRLTTRELSVLASISRSDPAPATRRGTARLILIDPAETLLREGTGFPLEPSTLVGRHPDCTIMLDDSFVSAEHASIERTADGWLLRDLGSTNGTFVNDQDVIGTRGISDGDIVQFGRVTMRLVC